MDAVNEDKELSEFVRAIGFTPESDYWSLHLQWSTTEPKNWVIQRNRLRPSDLLLTLTINSHSWRIELEIRDKTFLVQWRSSGISIESQQLKYRRRIKWPQISEPQQIIEAIPLLESCLDVQFVKHVNLQGMLVDKLDNPERLSEWLGLSINQFGCFK